MTTKELIQAEIESLDEQDLQELYSLIRQFVKSKQCSSSDRLMSRLKRIKIDAPEDFSVNLELYISGEKRV
ncbi:MAG: hypothetical protein RMJ55_19215 [Roseiflexaceae bacterium]|nr:hypothetical protein [Roseiflexus sp.]MDW8215688.1 hypothetical protein [Roseiflexaceae bacterium]